MNTKDLKTKTLPELYLIATQYKIKDFFGKNVEEMVQILKPYIENIDDEADEKDETSQKENKPVSKKQKRDIEDDDDIIDVDDEDEEEIISDDDEGDDEDEAPKKKKKAKPVVEDDEDEDEAPKKKKKAKPVVEDDEDDDEDEDEAPKKKKKKLPEGFGKKVETSPDKTDNPFADNSAGHYVFKALKKGGSMERIAERADAMFEKYSVKPPKDTKAKAKIIIQVINSGKKGNWGKFIVDSSKVTYDEP